MILDEYFYISNWYYDTYNEYYHLGDQLFPVISSTLELGARRLALSTSFTRGCVNYLCHYKRTDLALDLIQNCANLSRIYSLYVSTSKLGRYMFFYLLITIHSQAH
jgi:hypothetical protein